MMMTTTMMIDIYWERVMSKENLILGTGAAVDI